MHEQEPESDVYPVGLLHDLLFFGRTLRHAPTRENLTYAWRKFTRRLRTHWRQRSYWNGYLAEQTGGRAQRAGHGWTEHRAVEDLAHHLLIELPTEHKTTEKE